MNTIRINKGSTKMIAHRGLSGLETENSIQAFIAAGNRSYYGVETDVHVTRDGKFVVIHDDATGRVAYDDIKVEESTYELVRKIRLRSLCPAAGQAQEGKGASQEGNALSREGREPWEEGRQDLVIPNLGEYIGICKKYEKRCILELKNEFRPEDVERLVEEIKKMGYLEEVTFISFSLNNMICLRKLLPEQELYYLTGSYNEEIYDALKKHRLHLDIYYRALTREIVETLHKDGILVNCWTCDNKEEGERLAEWGVDYITSNLLE